jgi:hypothetical protein
MAKWRQPTDTIRDAHRKPSEMQPAQIFSANAMRTLRLQLLLWVLLLLAGCAHGLIGKLPEIEDPANSAEIFVLRQNSIYAGGQTAVVSFDSKKLFALKVREYAIFRAPPGLHRLRVFTPDSYSLISLHLPLTYELGGETEVHLSPGERYYYVFSFGWANVRLQSIEESAAQKMMTRMRNVPLE